MVYLLYVIDARTPCYLPALKRYGPYETEEACVDKWEGLCRKMYEEYSQECSEWETYVLDEHFGGWSMHRNPEGEVYLYYTSNPEKGYTLTGVILELKEEA